MNTISRYDKDEFLNLFYSLVPKFEECARKMSKILIR